MHTALAESKPLKTNTDNITIIDLVWAMIYMFERSPTFFAYKRHKRCIFTVWKTEC